jgi:hypothetical protein
MAIDGQVVGSLGLIRDTIECVPDDVEVLATTGEMQGCPAPQTDKQRTGGALLRDAPTGDRYRNESSMLA